MFSKKSITKNIPRILAVSVVQFYFNCDKLIQDKEARNHTTPPPYFHVGVGCLEKT